MPELLFTSDEHGTSLRTVYSKIESRQQTLFFIRNTENEVRFTQKLIRPEFLYIFVLEFAVSNKMKYEIKQFFLFCLNKKNV